MKVDKIDKFWYVMRYQPRTNPQDVVTLPRVRHSTFEEAETEGLRLAKKFPNANFVILAATHFVKVIPPAEPIYEVVPINKRTFEVGDIVHWGKSPNTFKILAISLTSAREMLIKITSSENTSDPYSYTWVSPETLSHLE